MDNSHFKQRNSKTNKRKRSTKRTFGKAITLRIKKQNPSKKSRAIKAVKKYFYTNSPTSSLSSSSSSSILNTITVPPGGKLHLPINSRYEVVEPEKPEKPYSLDYSPVQLYGKAKHMSRKTRRRLARNPFKKM